MSVRRFVGANSREAMRQVRAALGEDALILSNRTTAEGVEILAMADDEHQRLVPEPAAVQAPVARPAPSPAPLDLPPGMRQPPSLPPAGFAAQRAAAYQRTQEDSAAAAAVAATAAPQPVAPAAPAVDFAALGELLLGEMQGMRELLNRQMTPAASADSGAGRLRQLLLLAGFGVHLCDEILAALPAELGNATVNDPAARAWLERQLAARLPVTDDDNDLLDAGGVLALVGPTGVGKTTTTAKLAARYVMRHGSGQVALLSTDSYRIGAHEQLRIYGRLLGVEVQALPAEAALDAVLAQLAGKRLVIIDTIGMSQRDQRLIGQIAQLGGAGHAVRLMLLLNAASHGDTLEEVVSTYQRAARAAGSRLDDCIVTKSDEAARLGPVLDILIRHNLRLHYLSSGQQVPEDLHPAAAPALVRQALAASQVSPFVAADTTAPSAPGPRLEALSRGLLGHGRAMAAALDSLRREVDGFALLEAAWQLAALPRSLQGERLADLLAASPPADAGLLLWGRTGAQPGQTWQMPLLTFDAQGRLQARPWLAHQLPAGATARLEWAAQQWPQAEHLLAASPEPATLRALAAQGGAWLAAAKGNSRVDYLGERYALQTLAEIAMPQASLACRYRSHGVQLELSLLDVGLDAGRERGQHSGAWPLQAWFGQLHDLDSGRPPMQRFWLASSAMPGEQGLQQQQDLLLRQLQSDDLASLAGRAWLSLEGLLAPLQAELRLFLVAGLAATASHLERAEGDWAMDVRAQLLSLAGGRRQRSAQQQLDALLHLLAARDTFRQVAGSAAGVY
ncbi:flagellar biosynthesis protein FlhF [Pseudomonas sp. MAP12]|uniref:Flagellar biosynthesis protein FlhF n=1 Tax=Geopseudomonas aromaticivorans TaxID=2849492 RepID=A0ABS6MU13_9GAMM|nr:flagellar biosynthesis protein FlhF [Pseudomonas aromaticivorans]MBV2132294.1 flagellar biosynthesis protein FlhF [Pseudomonas aromaticivorans]